ncbi:MAG: TIGR00296 family protein [Candidatus Bathyarchaeia archaeon]|nr:TIGR00296 family protein [Candidatus Bathyarchaeota archaeon]
MKFDLSDEEGEFLVKLARRAVLENLKDGKIISPPKEVSPNLLVKRGVFVTINNVINGEKSLRGCIGFPYPIYPLVRAVIEAAIESATRDPRFPPMRIDELDNVVFEVSVLTEPELIKVDSPMEYPSKIKVGEDGLIVERGFYRGLLLPQVPIEWGWDEEEFLCQCCLKAGLSPDSWLLKGTKIYKFQAIIFEEISPNGPVIRKTLKRE